MRRAAARLSCFAHLHDQLAPPDQCRPIKLMSCDMFVIVSEQIGQLDFGTVPQFLLDEGLRQEHLAERLAHGVE